MGGSFNCGVMVAIHSKYLYIDPLKAGKKNYAIGVPSWVVHVFATSTSIAKMRPVMKLGKSVSIQPVRAALRIS